MVVPGYYRVVAGSACQLPGNSCARSPSKPGRRTRMSSSHSRGSIPAALQKLRSEGHFASRRHGFGRSGDNAALPLFFLPEGGRLLEFLCHDNHRFGCHAKFARRRAIALLSDYREGPCQSFSIAAGSNPVAFAMISGSTSDAFRIRAVSNAFFSIPIFIPFSIPSSTP